MYADPAVWKVWQLVRHLICNDIQHVVWLEASDNFVWRSLRCLRFTVIVFELYARQRVQPFPWIVEAVNEVMKRGFDCLYRPF